MTSFPAAMAASPSMIADALLFTTSAASAPVARRARSEMRACREPRLPESRSNSSSLYPRAATAAASMLSSLRGARPRFVCRITPVAFITPRGQLRHSRAADAARRARRSAISSNDGASAPSATAFLASASSSRAISTSASWGRAAAGSATDGCSSAALTDGIALNLDVMRAPLRSLGTSARIIYSRVGFSPACDMLAPSVWKRRRLSCRNLASLG